MAAHIAFLGAEQAETGLVAAFGIGEAGGEVLAGLFSVGHQITQNQCLAGQVKDPETASG